MLVDFFGTLQFEQHDHIVERTLRGCKGSIILIFWFNKDQILIYDVIHDTQKTVTCSQVHNHINNRQ